MGTDMPGLFAMGTFYYHGELVFGTCATSPTPSSCPSITSGTES
jgi:hypothetical protein